MKPRHLLLGAAVLIAAGFAFFGDKTPSGGVAEATPRQPARAGAVSVPAAPRAAAARPAQPDVAIYALLPRADLIGSSEFGGAETAFGSRNWAPPPPPPPTAAQVAAATPAPTAPPLPFTYLGKSLGDGHWEVFLARGERTFIVRAGAMIDGTYRVDTIAPPLLTLTYLPLNQVQQLNIGVLD